MIIDKYDFVRECKKLLDEVPIYMRKEMIEYLISEVKNEYEIELFTEEENKAFYDQGFDDGFNDGVDKVETDIRNRNVQDKKQ
jgi:hypothetical protein